MHARVAALGILLAVSTAGSAREAAGLRVHGLFGDGMVLQREKPVPVWGTSKPGDRITVSIAGQSKSAKTGPDGRWIVRLDPLAAGGPHELTVDGPGAVTFRDVLVGEVWVAAGGANMEMPLKAAKIAQTESDETAIGQLRFFVAPKTAAEQPETDLSGAWKSGRSDTAPDFSAIAYYFARDLQRVLKVPVGVLQATEDDSRVDQWMSRKALQSSRGGRSIVTLYGLQMGNYEAIMGMYRRHLMRTEEAAKNGTPPPPPMFEPKKPAPLSDLYNARILPMMPYAIRGAIWYQGESELYRSVECETVLPALIQGWRADWGQGEFPFGFVQLPNYGLRNNNELSSMWANFRESQRRALSTPNTGMAIAIDLGEDNNLRPRNKEDVGKRLGLWAQSQVYGKNLVYTGPLYSTSRVEGDRIRVAFKNVGGGLACEGKLRGFKLSGDFRRFVDADAEISGDTVIVSSRECPWPAEVRYGWADNPDGNLTNKEGLPATPFRTDNW